MLYLYANAFAACPATCDPVAVVDLAFTVRLAALVIDDVVRPHCLDLLRRKLHTLSRCYDHAAPH